MTFLINSRTVEPILGPGAVRDANASASPDAVLAAAPSPGFSIFDRAARRRRRAAGRKVATRTPRRSA